MNVTFEWSTPILSQYSRTSWCSRGSGLMAVCFPPADAKSTVEAPHPVSTETVVAEVCALIAGEDAGQGAPAVHPSTVKSGVVPDHP